MVGKPTETSECIIHANRSQTGGKKQARENNKKAVVPSESIIHADRDLDRGEGVKHALEDEVDALVVPEVAVHAQDVLVPMCVYVCVYVYVVLLVWFGVCVWGGGFVGVVCFCGCVCAYVVLVSVGQRHGGRRPKRRGLPLSMSSAASPASVLSLSHAPPNASRYTHRHTHTYIYVHK
jgi:hypothetical protein